MAFAWVIRWRKKMLPRKRVKHFERVWTTLGPYVLSNVLLTLCLEKFANISRMKIHFKIHLESFIYYFTLMTVNKVLGKLPKVLRDASLLYKWTLSDPPTLFLSFLACFPPSILPLNWPCSIAQIPKNLYICYAFFFVN